MNPVQLSMTERVFIKLLSSRFTYFARRRNVQCSDMHHDVLPAVFEYSYNYGSVKKTPEHAEIFQACRNEMIPNLSTDIQPYTGNHMML